MVGQRAVSVAEVSVAAGSVFPETLNSPRYPPNKFFGRKSCDRLLVLPSAGFSPARTCGRAAAQSLLLGAGAVGRTRTPELGAWRLNGRY